MPVPVFANDGKTPYRRGFVWYRSHFTAPKAAGGRVWLSVTGVEGKAYAWVNGSGCEIDGTRMHRKSFEVDVTDFVRPGRNSVVVRASRDFRDVLVVAKPAKPYPG